MVALRAEAFVKPSSPKGKVHEGKRPCARAEWVNAKIIPSSQAIDESPLDLHGSTLSARRTASIMITGLVAGLVPLGTQLPPRKVY